jgi:hypothetical protein
MIHFETLYSGDRAQIIGGNSLPMIFGLFNIAEGQAFLVLRHVFLLLTDVRCGIWDVRLFMGFPRS